MSIYCLWNDCSAIGPFVSLILGVGTILGVVICWNRTESVGLAIAAGIFSWFYVIYYVLIIRRMVK